MVLTGKYEHTLDSKNRLFIPAKHRELLGDSFMITCGSDHCLSVYSMEEWEKYTKKIEELPATQARTFIRFIYSNAQTAQPDAQGRVLLTADLVAFAQLQKDAVIIGSGNHAEIWSASNWQAQTEATSPEDITELMIQLGL